MIINVVLKDPDAFYEAIRDAANESLKPLPLTDKEKEGLKDDRAQALGNKLKTWVDYGEYIKIQFDTDKNTAIVLPKQSFY